MPDVKTRWEQNVTHVADVARECNRIEELGGSIRYLFEESTRRGFLVILWTRSVPVPKKL